MPLLLTGLTRNYSSTQKFLTRGSLEQKARKKGDSRHNNTQETGQNQKGRRKGKLTISRVETEDLEKTSHVHIFFNDREEDWDSDEDLDEDVPELDDTFIEFLRQDPRGPRLDSATIELISRYGVVDMESFAKFSQYSHAKLLTSLTNTEILDLHHEGIKNLHGYGQYISQHDLIMPLGLLNLDGFKPTLYTLYRKTE
jgi:hypothetical protein